MKMTHTVVQTINLAEPKSCEPPPPTQKLVNNRIPDPCPHIDKGIPKYPKTIIVPVRICKKEDVDRMYSPKVVKPLFFFA
jgi:hypothetical protein